MRALEIKEADTDPIKRERLTRLQGEMKRQGMGALYLADGVNVRYALNLTVPGGKVFVPAEGEPLAFARSRDFGYVSSNHGNTELLSHNISSTWVPKNADNVARFAHRLMDLMAEHGASGERLGRPLGVKLEHQIVVRESGPEILDACVPLMIVCRGRISR